MPLPSDLISRLLPRAPARSARPITTMLADGWQRYADIGSRYTESGERAENLMLHAPRLGRNFAAEMASVPTSSPRRSDSACSRRP